MTDRTDVGDFAAQRLRHGRQFGASRVRNVGALQRAARILSAPLVPVVFWSKIARRALATPQRGLRFLTARPFLLLFLTAWSTGELIGYATGREPQSIPSAEAANSEALR